MKPTRPFRAVRTRRRGAAAVEFAVSAPIFFLFLMAAFEFGWMNVIRHTADNAAYEAARTVMVPGATADEARSEAARLLNAVGAREAVVTISPDVLTPDTSQITVEIQVPMAHTSLVLARFTASSIIHASATLRTERAE